MTKPRFYRFTVVYDLGDGKVRETPTMRSIDAAFQEADTLRHYNGAIATAIRGVPRGYISRRRPD